MGKGVVSTVVIALALANYAAAALPGLPPHLVAAAAIVVSRLSCSEAMPTMDEVERLKAAQEKITVARK